MELETELARLKSLFDKGLIDEAEYREEKKSVLSSSRPSGSTPPQPSGIPQGTALSLVAGMTIGPDNNRLFRLQAKLGGGAMGEVWKAEDMAESKIVGHIVWVAVKALIPFLSAGERHREALKREAINAKKLSHAHIIRTHDWYEDKSIGGFPFLVMEYLEGQTLDQKLAQSSHFTYAETLDILNPIVEALSYAWAEHRIVHRDLKPDNIYLTAEGKLKLLDFGIAAQVRNTASAVGLSGFDSPGTLGYAPPEAGANRKPDPRFDIYGLGVLTYELLEGQLPFNGLRQTTTPLPEKPEALNEAQWQVLRQAMAYDTQERQKSAGEYLKALASAYVREDDEMLSAGHDAESSTSESEQQQPDPDIFGDESTEIPVIDSTEDVERKKIARDQARWEITKQMDSESGYRAYLDRAETDTYRAVVKKRLAELEAAKRKEQRVTSDAKRNLETLRARDEARWQIACASNSEAAYRMFLAHAETDTFRKQALIQMASYAIDIDGILYQPGAELPRESEIEPIMVTIPPGSLPRNSVDHSSTFETDSVDHQHEVMIDYWFAVGKYPVTREQYRRFVEDTGHGVRARMFVRFDLLRPKWDSWDVQEDSHPVVDVSWNDANSYVEWISNKTGKPYRLLNETEWKYACRAGTTTECYWGDIDADIGKYVVYEGNSNGKTAAVGSKQPNPWGLHDMIGNIKEWVADLSGIDESQNVGGSWSTGSRVNLGGSWNENLKIICSCRSYGCSPDYRDKQTGFRIARTLSLPE